jgi:hypothetical protein
MGIRRIYAESTRLSLQYVGLNNLMTTHELPFAVPHNIRGSRVAVIGEEALRLPRHPDRIPAHRGGAVSFTLRLALLDRHWAVVVRDRD